MQSNEPQKELQRIYARIAPEKISLLRFILEGYDGLTIMSTIDPKQGIISLRFHHKLADDVIELLEGISDQITTVKHNVSP
ncbi:MAG: DUF4911 domain-containing protein [Proteobacteria bacterium]|nr:DUF4911 domain-containing protein [Pseudomonadota bacterium]MBU1716491.1 DUF4911 domain-containing protein [Pseudomonadota bacterium]